MLKKVLIPFLIAISFVLLITVRFIYLNEFPVGILNDEVDVSLSSKSYYSFGTDLSGVVFPKSLFVTSTSAGLSGLPSYLLTYIYGPFNLSPQIIRIPFVILSLLTILIIYLIIFEITKNKKFAIISSFVSLINPWLYFYSRQPTEAPFALFFALIAIYIFLKFKGLKILWSILFFIASFYSYFGAKPVIPVLMIVLSLVYKKSRLLIIFFAVLIVSSYYLISLNLSENTLTQRENQLTFLNFNNYSQVVDDNRRQSLEFPLKVIFYNKYNVFVNISSSKFLSTFSPSFLFLTGDSVVPFENHGVLYLIDLLFIILSVFYFIKSDKNSDKKLFMLVLVMLIAGAVGPTISLMGNQFVFRAFLHIPAYIILIAYAISKINFNIFIFIIYGLLYINFLAFFLFRYSIDQQDNHFISERILSSYLKRMDNIVVISQEPERVYYQAVFYNENVDRNIFTSTCPKEVDNKTYIVDAKINCKFNNEFVVIQSQKDAGVKYKIYNDTLCDKEDLTVYRRNHFISDYNVENMNDKIFCNRWIQNGKTN